MSSILKHLRILTLVTLVIAALVATAGASSCPGLERNRLISSEWTTDLLHDGSGTPVVVELVAKTIATGTTVEYFDGSSWQPMSEGVAVDGSRVRFTTGGTASFRATRGGCNDDWTTTDDH
jgi:hypothetical protein